MTNTLYTVIDNGSGEAIDTGLTAADAAAVILTDDSQEYDILEDDDGGFMLWTRQQVANKGWTRTVVFSIKTERAEAEADIFDKVIAADWPRHPTAMTDEAYRAMMSEFEADAE